MSIGMCININTYNKHITTRIQLIKKLKYTFDTATLCT